MFSPSDFLEAHETAGAMCGHGALAALLGKPVMEVMPLFPKPGWVNVPMMKAALTKFGQRWERIPLMSPEDQGVILVQFLGPWTEPGVPPAAACRYRHWVAARFGFLWDINWPEWQSPETWKKRVPELLPERSTGYEAWGSIRIF